MTTDDHNEAIALREAIVALIAGIGHGGLKQAAQSIGMTSSALRKRLQQPDGGFDVPTMRAMVLMRQTNGTLSTDAKDIRSTKTTGDYTVQTLADGTVKWQRSPRQPQPPAPAAGIPVQESPQTPLAAPRPSRAKKAPTVARSGAASRVLPERAK